MAPDNRVAVLPNGTTVMKLAEVSSDWWQIQVTLNGVTVKGYAAKAYLEAEAPLAANLPAGPAWPCAVHFREHDPAVTLNAETNKASPIGQTPPQWPSGAADKVHAVVEWLDVEHSLRYQPKPRETYCNIYAYDVCYFAGAFLPRVWWNDSAISRLRANQPVPVQYGATVRELNANSLHDWFEDYGADFHWTRCFSPYDLQQAADSGNVGIIVAQKANLNQSGHITVAMPQRGNLCCLTENGTVLAPLQSQTGRHPRKHFSSVWWSGQQFRSFSFWFAPVS